MSVVSNLFPPIMAADAAPAFVRTDDCRIYFSLSSYNSLQDIKHVQVTLVNQKTNQNAFKTSLYPLGIKFISSISVDSNVNNSYKYYITIDNTDVDDNVFGLNTFYKVQIRFSSVNKPVTPTAAWINSHLDDFSEWSQVCLIKGIEQPYININEFGNDDPESPFYDMHMTYVGGQFTFLSGRLYYNDNANIEKETLKSFNVCIKSPSGDDVLVQSEEIYTDPYNPNEIYYQIRQQLQDSNGEYYIIEINYTTINLYTHTSTFHLGIEDNAQNELHATIDITPQPDRGRMKINITFKEMYNTHNNLAIRRTSSRSNFLQWDNIKILQHDFDFEHLWYDTTIESGVWYKYRVIQAGIPLPKISNAAEPVICVFDDMFMTNNDRQLRLQFNPTVSDFRYNVNESQQVTLGSQFPYIKRNGDNYYRSFSVSGLISALMDEQGWYDPNYNDEHGYFYHKNVAETFTTPQQVYGDAATALYSAYNEENNITEYNDYIYERQFRQKVMDYLYKNNIKLFRSLTEGNILVKLTNIALSPIDTLGRMLYSVSASATQIDNATIDNLKKYNIINKFYYTYAKLSITDTFENERSLINRFYEQLPTVSRKLTDIMQLTFTYAGPEDIIVYAKPAHNKIMFRYALDNGNLVLAYSDADPIAECYFWGTHIDSSDYIETNQYYNSTDEITNPINMGVYYIIKQYVYLINHYIDYYSDAGLLDTYPEEVVPSETAANEQSLLVEPLYYKMIYYGGQWYPFSENQDIMVNSLNATIEYLYRTKKED